MGFRPGDNAAWCGWCGSPIYAGQRTEKVGKFPWHEGCVAEHAKTELESQPPQEWRRY